MKRPTVHVIDINNIITVCCIIEFITLKKYQKGQIVFSTWSSILIKQVWFYLQAFFLPKIFIGKTTDKIKLDPDALFVYQSASKQIYLYPLLQEYSISVPYKFLMIRMQFSNYSVFHVGTSFLLPYRYKAMLISKTCTLIIYKHSITTTIDMFICSMLKCYLLCHIKISCSVLIIKKNYFYLKHNITVAFIPSSGVANRK